MLCDCGYNCGGCAIERKVNNKIINYDCLDSNVM